MAANSEAVVQSNLYVWGIWPHDPIEWFNVAFVEMKNEEHISLHGAGGILPPTLGPFCSTLALQASSLVAPLQPSITDGH